jgi:hypothetical protein
MFNLQAFINHQQKVATAMNLAYSAGENAMIRSFAQSFLDTLASKNGNDILEPVLVEATGRDAKSIAKKHGADSEDGELESKPFKTKYNAHISDDTPASLLRHHTIPYIALGQASKDGRVIYWALYTSYRIFDNSRYKGIVNTLPLSEKAVFSATLPTQMEERHAILLQLEKTLGRKKYVRSNPLPMQDICQLKAGEFTLWVNPLVDIKLIDKNIAKLNADYPGSVLTTEYMQPFVAMRAFCINKKTAEDLVQTQAAAQVQETKRIALQAKKEELALALALAKANK